MLKHKSEVFEKFTDWKSMVEESSGMKVKVLRTDNGGEYTLKEFEQYLKMKVHNMNWLFRKHLNKMESQNAWIEHLWKLSDQY